MDSWIYMRGREGYRIIGGMNFSRFNREDDPPLVEKSLDLGDCGERAAKTNKVLTELWPEQYNGWYIR